jgi:protein-disulfide isomerase
MAMRWVVVAVLVAGGCSDNDEVIDKLGKIDERLVELEDKVDNTEKRLVEIGSRLDDDQDDLSLGRGDTLASRLARIEDKLGQLTARPTYTPPPTRRTYDRPDPAAVYAVPIAGAPFRGSRDARVTVVKAFEFACPFCERTRGTIDQLLDRYEGKIKVVYKHFIVHPSSATEPAQAACAAGLQDKWAPMARLIWDEGYKNGRKLDRDHMATLARKAKLDMARFERDRDGRCKALVSKDQSELRAVGVRGTPAFFINGRFLSGARPIDQFAALIDEELTRADERIRGGTAVADYYQTWVLDRGKSSL